MTLSELVGMNIRSAFHPLVLRWEDRQDIYRADMDFYRKRLEAREQEDVEWDELIAQLEPAL